MTYNINMTYSAAAVSIFVDAYMSPVVTGHFVLKIKSSENGKTNKIVYIAK